MKRSLALLTVLVLGAATNTASAQPVECQAEEEGEPHFYVVGVTAEGTVIVPLTPANWYGTALKFSQREGPFREIRARGRCFPIPARNARRPLEIIVSAWTHFHSYRGSIPIGARHSSCPRGARLGSARCPQRIVLGRRSSPGLQFYGPGPRHGLPKAIAHVAPQLRDAYRRAVMTNAVRHFGRNLRPRHLAALERGLAIPPRHTVRFVLSPRLDRSCDRACLRRRRDFRRLPYSVRRVLAYQVDASGSRLRRRRPRQQRGAPDAHVEGL